MNDKENQRNFLNSALPQILLPGGQLINLNFPEFIDSISQMISEHLQWGLSSAVPEKHKPRAKSVFCKYWINISGKSLCTVIEYY